MFARVNPRAVRVGVLLGLMAVSASGCNRRLLAAFFDIPTTPRTARPAQPAGPQRRDSALAATTVAQLAPTPFVPLNGILNADSMVKRLPRDHAGNVDWTAALRTGVIRPSAALAGGDSTQTGLLRFNFDFFIPPSADTTVVTWFPHTGHTEWLSCNSCHLRIFPYRRPVKMSMDDLSDGKFCGECHGPVAFPIETGCERCHPKEEMTAGEAKPDLLGTTRMRRMAGDTTDPPRAVFPHWVHRTRYVCAVCHDQLFVPKAGKNVSSMELISSGKSCGVCHDGKRAFAADFDSCNRCHVGQEKPARKAGQGP